MLEKSGYPGLDTHFFHQSWCLKRPFRNAVIYFQILNIMALVNNSRSLQESKLQAIHHKHKCINALARNN